MVTAGLQSFSSSSNDRQTVPDGYTLGWNKGGSNLPVNYTAVDMSYQYILLLILGYSRLITFLSIHSVISFVILSLFRPILTDSPTQMHYILIKSLFTLNFTDGICNSRKHFFRNT